MELIIVAEKRSCVNDKHPSLSTAPFKLPDQSLDELMVLEPNEDWDRSDVG